MDATLQKQGHKRLKFAISNKWITADEGQMQRLHTIHYFQDSVYQSVAFEIGEIA